MRKKYAFGDLVGYGREIDDQHQIFVAMVRLTRHLEILVLQVTIMFINMILQQMVKTYPNSNSWVVTSTKIATKKITKQLLGQLRSATLQVKSGDHVAETNWMGRIVHITKESFINVLETSYF